MRQFNTSIQKGQGTRVRGQVLNHLYKIEKWHVKQERIQIAESIHIPSCKGQQVQKMRKDSSREWYVNLPLKTKTGIPTAHQMNSSPTRSINFFKTERIRYLSVCHEAHIYI